MTISAPSCSIVVCTRNRADLLRRCLESLALVEYPNFEVLIVDNAPDDDQTHWVACRAGVRYAVEPVRGLSRARNFAARNSSADVLAYIDDDCVVDTQWLANLASQFHDPSVAAVTGRILPLSANTNAEQFCAAQHWMDLGNESRTLSRDLPDWFEAVNSPGIGFGGNMAFRRSLFESWSGFDERLGRGSNIGAGEENYAFLQLISQGHKVIYNPSAIVYHPYPEQMGPLRSSALESHSATAAFYVLLCIEHPEFRRFVIRHLLRKRKNIPSLNQINSRSKIALARMRGVFRYLKERAHHRLR